MPAQGFELSWCLNGAACSPAAHVCGTKPTELSLRKADKTFPVGNASALCPSCLALWPWPLELLHARQAWGQLPWFPLVNEVISANDNELKHPCLACSLVCSSHLHSCQEGSWIPVMTKLICPKNLGLCFITEVCREGKD